jgi:hypothetical protein
MRDVMVDEWRDPAALEITFERASPGGHGVGCDVT